MQAGPTRNDLYEQIAQLARTPTLVVASDFDGVLSPIVLDPNAALPDVDSLRALERLAALPRTHVAIISGRRFDDLSARVHTQAPIELIGEHGNATRDECTTELCDRTAPDRLNRLAAEFDSIAQRFAGAHVERKATTVGIHYRRVDPALHDELLELVSTAHSHESPPRVYCGKMVIECSFARSGKGAALDRLRRNLDATALVFLGDDATDEDAFASLALSDLAIKIGPERTLAPHRVESIDDVRHLLAMLAEERARWLTGGDSVPIEQHALLSDQRTIALVDPRGRLSWMCLPRIDSSALFAELVGGPSAGFFEIAPPSGERPIGVEYVGDSLVLRTRWAGIDVYDYLDAAHGRAFQRPGRTDLVRTIEGRGTVRIVFAPRRDFGRIATHIAVTEHGLVVEGGVDPLMLHAPGVRFEIVPDGPHHTAIAHVEIGSEPLVLEMRYGTGNLAPPLVPEAKRRESNRRFWEGWAATLHVPSLARSETIRSALVLKALTYGPTGAIAAAATTSLPEALDGDRNWDYRFCWPRDAAIAAHSLALLGMHGPGLKLLDWLLGLLEDPSSALLVPVYTVSGGHLGPEAELTHLAGYRGTRPVRVSNAAASQVQLDVFGPIAELVAELARTAAPLSTEHLDLLSRMVDTVAQRWREPDHGIWEIRLPQRHHIHSKVMCWVTVDRALRVAKYLGREVREWVALREAILTDLLEHGVVDGAFGTCYGDGSADAAALWTGLAGAIAPNDPRFLATIDRVTRDLESHGSIYRYRFDDGLKGREGAFHLCTTWWIESLAIAGREDDALRAFDSYLRHAGPTGLFTEEFDPERRIALGNTPQAYSHAGLIRVATRLDALAPRLPAG